MCLEVPIKTYSLGSRPALRAPRRRLHAENPGAVRMRGMYLSEVPRLASTAVLRHCIAQGRYFTLT